MSSKGGAASSDSKVTDQKGGGGKLFKDLGVRGKKNEVGRAEESGELGKPVRGERNSALSKATLEKERRRSHNKRYI